MDATVRRVGVLAPMPSELGPVVRTMGLTRTGSGHAHHGRVGRVEVVATRTGMGLTLATEATRRLLDEEQVDHVLVVGIAGGIGGTRVGDLVRPATVVDRSTGTRYDATPLGEHAAVAGVISSSDEFVVEPERVDTLVAEGVRALDMETSAIAAVCAEHGVPWSAVRVISDLASDHPDAAVLGLANPDGTPNASASIRFLARNPHRIPGLVRLARDSTRAARAAAAEAHRQLQRLT
jgi:adenosylhomocysteine nucleosidase